jgi:hypothetical protein
LKIKEAAKRKIKLREKYVVPIPSDKELFGQIAKDKLAREEGCSQTSVGEGIREGLIEFWRRNRMNYPPPLSASERRKRLREEEEEKERRGTCMRNMREKWCRDWREFDPSRIFAKDSIAEWFQMAEAKKRGINLKLARIEAKMAQLQAMKALVRDCQNLQHKKSVAQCRGNCGCDYQISMGGNKETCYQGARGGGQGQGQGARGGGQGQWQGARCGGQRQGQSQYN